MPNNSGDAGSSRLPDQPKQRQSVEYHHNQAGFNTQESQQPREMSDSDAPGYEKLIKSVRKQAKEAGEIYQQCYPNLPEDLKITYGDNYDEAIKEAVKMRDAFNRDRSNENFEHCQKAVNDLTVLTNTMRAKAVEKQCTEILDDLEKSESRDVQDILYVHRGDLSGYMSDIKEALEKYQKNPPTLEQALEHQSAVLQLKPLGLALEKLAQEAEVIDRIDRRE